VLEAGAGTSSTALILAPSVAHYTSSDISAEMVAIGREKIAEQSVTNVDVVHGVLGDPALGSGPYDAVLAFNLLHLTRDPRQQARHAANVLKPGGYFITKTAVRTVKLALLLPVLWAARMIGKAPFVNLMSRRDLERQITEAGFEIVETASHGAHFIVARKR
jgi:2-polyprenyl-3-methyl-5-hydroxy-6-metoxy-1,4-benzoquinol methylase